MDGEAFLLKLIETEVEAVLWSTAVPRRVRETSVTALEHRLVYILRCGILAKRLNISERRVCRKGRKAKTKMFNNIRIFLPAALLAVGFLSSTPAKASLLFGTVNFNGNNTISQGLIHFIDPSGNPNGQVTVTSSTGDFSGDAGGVGFLKDISNSSFPIPTGAGSLPDFITAPAFPSTTHFTMTFLFPGVQGVAGCITGPNCTPLNSPFNLTNTSPSTSTASFADAVRK